MSGRQNQRGSVIIQSLVAMTTIGALAYIGFGVIENGIKLNSGTSSGITLKETATILQFALSQSNDCAKLLQIGNGGRPWVRPAPNMGATIRFEVPDIFENGSYTALSPPIGDLKFNGGEIRDGSVYGRWQGSFGGQYYLHSAFPAAPPAMPIIRRFLANVYISGIRQLNPGQSSFFGGMKTHEEKFPIMLELNGRNGVSQGTLLSCSTRPIYMVRVGNGKSSFECLDRNGYPVFHPSAGWVCRIAKQGALYTCAALSESVDPNHPRGEGWAEAPNRAQLEADLGANASYCI